MYEVIDVEPMHADEIHERMYSVQMPLSIQMSPSGLNDTRVSLIWDALLPPTRRACPPPGRLNREPRYQVCKSRNSVHILWLYILSVVRIFCWSCVLLYIFYSAFVSGLSPSSPVTTSRYFISKTETVSRCVYTVMMYHPFVSIQIKYWPNSGATESAFW